MMKQIPDHQTAMIAAVIVAVETVVIVAAAAVNNDWLLNIVFQRKSLPVYKKQEDFFFNKETSCHTERLRNVGLLVGS